METDRQKEAERLYCRLMSSDPDFNDCTDAANFIRAVAADLKGPDGFESWRDAAVDERVRRVKAEAELAEMRRAQPEANADAKEWHGSIAQIICDIPLPDRSTEYQHGFVTAKEAILDALRKSKEKVND